MFTLYRKATNRFRISVSDFWLLLCETLGIWRTQSLDWDRSKRELRGFVRFFQRERDNLYSECSQLKGRLIQLTDDKVRLINDKHKLTRELAEDSRANNDLHGGGTSTLHHWKRAATS